jgi:AcrR family transcriptional regulator
VIILEQKSEDTRERILEAAKRIFTEQGFHETSMSSIAAEAGLGKGTLYWYFSSKEELFYVMMEQQGRIIIDTIHNICSYDLPADLIIKSLIELSIKRMLENKKTVQLFFEHEFYIKNDLKDRLINLYLSILNEVKNVIQKGINEGLFEADNLRLITAIVVGTIDSLRPYIFTHKDTENIDELVDLLYNFILKGIGKRGIV